MAAASTARRQEFEEQGYTIAEGLFSQEECDRLIAHYMEMRKSTQPGDESPVDPNAEDPLKRFPRLLMPHRFDEMSREWLLEPRIRDAMTEILGTAPYAVQTMVYFKPPGARGQALHQDQFYLRVQPGTCCAAWLALDDCDEDNGCMEVVPKTHELPVLCTIPADTTVSFTDVTVPLPEGYQPVPMRMKKGDVLFFNGQVVHGSYANTSKNRFRRALIGHYIQGEAEKVHEWYHPVYSFDGSIVEFGKSQTGSRCGVWVEEDGVPVVEEVERVIAGPTRID